MPLPVDHPGVTQTCLPEALALGPGAWDALRGVETSPSPFMSWAWHRAWSTSAPRAEVDATRGLVLHGADRSIQAVLPVRMLPGSAAMTWTGPGKTFGAVPDNLEVYFASVTP